MRVWFHALPSVCVYVFATFLAFHEACGERGTENKRWRARMVVASRMERRSRRCREVWPRQESRICSVFRSSSSTSFAFPPSLYLLPPSPLICFDLLLLSVSLSLSVLLSARLSPLSFRLSPSSPTWCCCSGTNLPTTSRFYLPASQRPDRIREQRGTCAPMCRLFVEGKGRGSGFMSRRSCKVEGGSFSWCSLPRFVVVSKQGGSRHSSLTR